MARGDRGRKAQILGRRGYAFGRRRMVGEIAVDVDQAIVVRAPNPEVSTGQTDALYGAVGEPYLFRLSKAIEGELQGRGAAVETQDDLLADAGSGCIACPRRRSETHQPHPLPRYARNACLAGGHRVRAPVRHVSDVIGLRRATAPG